MSDAKIMSKRVAERLRPIAVAVTEKVHKQRAVTGQRRVRDDSRKVGRGRAPEPVEVHDRELLTGKVEIPKKSARWLEEQILHRDLYSTIDALFLSR